MENEKGGERKEGLCVHTVQGIVLIGNIANKIGGWTVFSRPCSHRVSKHILPCWMLQSLSCCLHYQNCLWCFCFPLKCLQQQWLRLNTAWFKRTFSVCLKGRKRRCCPSPVLSERGVCSSRFWRKAGGHKVEGTKGCQNQTLWHCWPSAPCWKGMVLAYQPQASEEERLGDMAAHCLAVRDDAFQSQSA